MPPRTVHLPAPLGRLVVGMGLVLWLAAPAAAQGGPPEAAEPTEPRRRVAALVLTTGDLDPAMASALSEVLIGALAARGGVTLVGLEELQAQLGQGDAGTLECIGSMACLGRAGVQLDVVEIVAGTLAQRDSRWVFNLNRVDLREGEIVGRVFREVEGDLGAVADALHAAVPELYAPPEPEPEPEPPIPPAPPEPAPGALIVRTPVTGAEVTVDGALVGLTASGGLSHELPAGSYALEVGASGYHRWQRTVAVRSGAETRIEVALEEAWTETVHPWVIVGASIAGAALGVGIGLGVASQERLSLDPDNMRTGEISRAEAVAYYDARRAEALAANVLFGVAGAAAASAVLFLFFPERARVEGVAVLPAPGGLTLRGAF